MLNLAAAALTPVLIVAIYIYIRDKYEKEPLQLLFTGVLYGVIITVPIVLTGNLVMILIPNSGVISEALFMSFMVAALVEEFYKYIVLYFLVWKNCHFNERFDGIVYAAFISLGFAGIENILYVFNPQLGGAKTALARAIFSVPGHALFGVAMGFYFAMARFEQHSKKKYIALAFIVPWLLHGVYNFILISGMPYLMAVFIPYVVYLWISGLRKMKAHLLKSPFRLS